MDKVVQNLTHSGNFQRCRRGIESTSVAADNAFEADSVWQPPYDDGRIRNSALTAEFTIHVLLEAVRRRRR